MTTVKGDIRALIISRLIIVTTLLVAAVVIQLSTGSFLPLGPFYALIAGSYALSLIYFLLFRWETHHRAQAYLQIVFDLLLITLLVYISGGINGNLYFLYVFVIVAASLVLGNRAAYLAASLAAILFGGLADGMYYKLIPYFRQDQFREISVGLVLYTVFLAWGLFFVMAFLLNHLAQSLRKTRQALAGAQKELEIKERQAAAGRMAALIAHEIRNPLAAISGSVQVLKNELAVNPEQAKLMDIVLTESLRVSRSIDQFLSLAAPGKEIFTTFDLGEVMRETLTMLKMSGELDERTAVKGNFETTRLDFRGSPGQLKQVFWNLTRNSLRAMPDGGELSIDFVRESRDRVALRFADTGRGMSDEEKARMFEPFFSRFEGGQGLGLAVVKKIVDDYEGQIRVVSEALRGTEILITLPLRPAKKAERE
ncbi:MAG: ATP-binding protein [Candidatus Aminicenantes bacterium]|nr:ATP-binding protein [Candidatus Aminicenantes bacterium]